MRLVLQVGPYVCLVKEQSQKLCSVQLNLIKAYISTSLVFSAHGNMWIFMLNDWVIVMEWSPLYEGV